MMIKIIIKIVIMLAVCLASTPVSADVLFSDSTFNNSDWNAFEAVDTTPGNTFVFTGTQLLTGGNPGAYRQVTQSSVSDPAGGNVYIDTAHVFLPAHFNPGEDGSIASIDFWWDGISINSTAGAVGYGGLLIQDGHVYAGPGSMPLNDQGWQTANKPGLTAVDFYELLDGPTPWDLNAHPNLTDSGSPLQFGFFSGNGTFGNSFNEGGVDNWGVRINLQPVPEPATMLLLGLGLIGLAGVRRKFQK